MLGYVRLPLTPSVEQIMAMPVQRAAKRRWTEEEFYKARDAAPQGERWELVTPSPHWTHQRAVMRLAVLLYHYVRTQKIGETFAAPLHVNIRPGLVPPP